MTQLTYGEIRSRTERIIDANLKERVLAGLESLQEKWGDEWVEKIDCETLDLRDGNQCVLGQVCGAYGDGLVLLAGDDAWSKDDWPAKHGFVVLSAEAMAASHEECRAAWDALDRAWHDVLCEREENDESC